MTRRFPTPILSGPISAAIPLSSPWRRAAAMILWAILAVLGGLRAAQPVEWQQIVINQPPSPRIRTAMAYDSARGVTVLFGGQAGGIRFDETWEWNGTEWTERIVTGPSARKNSAMAYDPVRGVAVLFGGYGPSGLSGETWEWDGAAWALRIVSGPSEREGHAMVYDSARGVTVLFGGDTYSGRSSETWEWNGTAWTQRMVTGSSPRYHHAMAYDSARGKTVLFGGYGPPGSGLSAETWEWDGAAWTLRIVSGPTARSGHAMGYDSARAKTVLFGGSTPSGNSSETWEWDGTAWTQRLVSLAPRADHAMAYDSARGEIVLSGDSSGETWEWNGSQWTRRGVIPSGRFGHAMAYDSDRHVTVLFGGWTNDGSNGETWEWNGTSWTQRAIGLPPGQRPSPRLGHTMFYDTDRHVTVLFGGYEGYVDVNEFSVFDNDLWEWNGTTGIWTQRTYTFAPPTGRHQSRMIYDSTHHVGILFGGMIHGGGVDPIDYTWSWNGSNATWIAVLPLHPRPTERFGHAMAYDSARDRTVMFGGRQAASLIEATTHEWSSATQSWPVNTLVAPRPPEMFAHAMAYDVDRAKVVLFGGTALVGNPFDQTWEWDGTAWAQRMISGPSSRANLAMVHDSYRQETVLFGGFDGTSPCADTWRLRPCAPATITTQPVPVAACIGSFAAFTVAATGNNLTYQWRKGTNAISAGANPSAITPTLILQNILPGDAGSYDCIVTGTCGGVVTNAPSTAASLSVRTPLTITQQPAAQATCIGSSAAFTVAAAGTGPISYQWYGPSGFMTGATSATLTINPVASQDQGEYYCRVSSACGTVSSAAAALTFGPPTITQQPVSLARCAGASASFTVAATGVSLSYQWVKTAGAGAGTIAGATGPTYTIPSVAVANAGSYVCTVTSPCAGLASNTVTLTVGAAPIITQQPVSQSACPGIPTSFTIAASGTPPYSYAWRRNGTPVGGNSATLNIPSPGPGDIGTYDCTVSHACGSALSAGASLTLGAPTFTQQPASQAVCPGQPAAFGVASGSPITAWQWYSTISGIIPGATSAGYSIPSVTPADAGGYFCLITTLCGQFQSATGTLTVNTPVAITQQPSTQVTCPGGSAVFTVAAAGTGPLSYQWYGPIGFITGATNPTLTLNPVAPTDQGPYRCRISNTCGSVYSDDASLVFGPPIVTQQPESQVACLGAPAGFTVAASGNNLAYQWYKDGVIIPGATGPTYTIPSVAAGHAGTYACVINNTCAGLVTDIVTLTVHSVPQVTVQPVSQVLAVLGMPAAFSVTATDATGFQWRKNTVPIAGAQSAGYFILAAAAADLGAYDCLVTNACGSTPSAGATLTLACYPNCDHSTIPPVLNVQDFACYLNAFAAGDPYANCDGSTTPPTLNVQDFACFLNSFAAGCP